LIGLVMASFPVEFLLKYCLKEKYIEYTEYSNYRIRGNAKVLGKRLLVFFIAFAGIIVFLGVNCNFRVTSKGVLINRFFNIKSKKYYFSEIHSIFHSEYQKTKKKGYSRKNHYIILFKDKTKWTSLDGAINPNDIYLNDMIGFILKRANKRLNYVERFE